MNNVRLHVGEKIMGGVLSNTDNLKLIGAISSRIMKRQFNEVWRKVWEEKNGQ